VAPDRNAVFVTIDNPRLRPDFAVGSLAEFHREVDNPTGGCPAVI
jgi:hypothetical protein